ncbi:hypothetical protein FHS43_000562 [Streptosporangium becharense]|uniref:Uncharacterized protein n=1 Tax=Streptosporangium becharense TaxID=1816182 RepID=A0A7W9MKJ1_9ACTN|nr:hypothetical protein [Streptosporangium becharense]MBB2909316.1 hypothetical protein [Streptosporangium becharense]MBB5823781.1 hypothetical protein [Streptosporangium becharense]
MQTYDAVTVQAREGEPVRILQAPVVAAFACEFLAGVGAGHVDVDDEGNLVIADQVAYRPVRFERGGTVIVCERVR